MEDDSGIGCSVWLVPENTAAKKITSIISELSQRYATPLFEPHITIAKGIKNTNNLPGRFREFFKSTLQFELSTGGINIDEHFFKCVFIEVEKTAFLSDLRKKADSYFRVPERQYNPHISLLYSDISMAERERTARSLSVDIKKFAIKKVKLYLTIGKAYEWKELASVSLKTLKP